MIKNTYTLGSIVRELFSLISEYRNGTLTDLRLKTLDDFYFSNVDAKPFIEIKFDQAGVGSFLTDGNFRYECKQVLDYIKASNYRSIYNTLSLIYHVFELADKGGVENVSKYSIISEQHY